MGNKMFEFNKKIKKVSNIRNLKNLLILCLTFVMLFPAVTNPLIINIKSDGQKTSFINLEDSGVYTLSFIHINGSIANNWSDTAVPRRHKTSRFQDQAYF